MSRSNNTEIKGIATRYFEWSGSEGKLKYYDKEEKENVFVPIPFTFIVLDKLHTIVGYSDSDESGFWSNEVRDISTEKLSVRTKENKYPAMLYKDMADLLNKGAKYAQSVYIAFKDESASLVIGHLKLSGSAIGNWIEFNKTNDVYKIGCKLASCTAEKKGATKYFAPVFTKVEISEGTNAEALELDKQVQEYLTKYFGRGGQESNRDKEVIEETSNKANDAMKDEVPETRKMMVNTVPDDDLPF